MPIRSLGRVNITASGTPVRLTANEPDPTVAVRAHAVIIQAWHANGARIFVGAANMNTSSGLGVYGIVPVPSANACPSLEIGLDLAPAAFDLSKMYIDGATDEGAIVSYVEL